MRIILIIISILLNCFVVAQNRSAIKFLYEPPSSGKLIATDKFSLFDMKPIQYVGLHKDSLNVRYTNPQPVNHILRKNYLKPNDTIHSNYNKIKYELLEIFVDESQSTPLSIDSTDMGKITTAELDKEIDRMNEGQKPSREIPFVTTFYEGFPVIISNKSKEMQIIGFGNHIPLELEAFSQEKKWEKVYGPHKYTCGTGVQYIVLRTNEIAVLYEPKLTGNLKTKFRYRLANVVSNEFEGSINKDLIGK